MITLNEITQIVSEHYELHPMDLFGPGRPRHIADPRMVAYTLSRELTGASWQIIGNHYGRRDHTTVYKGFSSIKRRLPSDPFLSLEYDRLTRHCKALDSITFKSRRAA